MFGLTPTVTAVILTIILAVVALAYMLFGWLRKRSWRVLLRGIGFALIPLGLLAMGLMTKAVNGVQALVDWANATAMDAWIMIGLIVGGIGLAAYLVGSFIPHVAGEEAASRRQAIKARRLAAMQQFNAAPPPTDTRPPSPSTTVATTTSTAPAATTTAAPDTDEDKEVDDILRRHGIA